MASALRTRVGILETQHILRSIRSHLGMDVAFVSEFVDGARVFRGVDADGVAPVAVGAGDPLEETYCQRVVDGRLPELIHNAADLPEAAVLPVTHALPVGAHLSVPIVLSDGRLFGTFCCFSHAPDFSLTARDLDVMRVFADLVAERIDSELRADTERSEIVERIESVLGGAGLATAVQPIVALENGTVVGHEALLRFTGDGPTRPDLWFADAVAVGLDVELDLAAARTALDARRRLGNNGFYAINVTPATLASGRLTDHLLTTASPGLEGLVLEVTEHAAVESYEDMDEALAPLRDRGVQVAVDDAGAGYASFRHILRLEPDFIKLDMALTRDIDRDPAKRALATALISFAADTGSSIVAEGIENDGELDTLRALGVTIGQGYHLGRPTLI